jgi:hypothetical protein
LPDKNLTAFKTKLGGQADRLTPAIEKELCGARHRQPSQMIYTMAYYTESMIKLGGFIEEQPTSKLPDLFSSTYSGKPDGNYSEPVKKLVAIKVTLPENLSPARSP